jgi:tetratricopeptide (TPR) repeat protein
LGFGWGVIGQNSVIDKESVSTRRCLAMAISLDASVLFGVPLAVVIGYWYFRVLPVSRCLRLVRQASKSSRQGEWAAAEGFFLKALAQAEMIGWKQDLVPSVQAKLAFLLVGEKRYVESERMARAALSCVPGFITPQARAESLFALTQILLVQDRFAELKPLAEELAQLARLFDANQAEALCRLGAAQFMEGRFRMAAASSRTALAAIPASAERGLVRCTALTGLGCALTMLNELPEAIETLRRAADLARRLAPEEPIRGAILVTLGDALLESGDVAAAETVLREAVELQSKKRGGDDLPLTQALCGLANTLLKADRTAEAEALIVRAGALPAGQATCDVRGLHGLILRKRGELEQAIVCLTEALELGQKRFGSEHRFLLETIEDLAETLRMAGNLEEASVYTERARRIREAFAEA